MNKVFYTFLFNLAVVILFFLVTFICLRVNKFLIWREFKRNFRFYSDSKRYWLCFNATCLVVLAAGFLFSWFCTGRLTFGLLAMGLIPVLLRKISVQQSLFVKRELELSALSFFYGLLGLIQSGQGFSTALFELTRSLPGSFSNLLRKYLKNYEEGKGLFIVLRDFRQKSKLPLIGTYLATLEMAYSQGLPLAPFLEQMIPTLEQEQHYQQKVEALRKQSLAQAAMAFLVPWFLTFVLWWFNPELFQSLQRQYFLLVGIALMVLISETMGVWFLWQFTRFG